MEKRTENTVPQNATSQTDSDWMKREAKYQVTMKMFKKWLENGLITKEEFAVISTKMGEKYRPKIGSLLLG